MKKYTKFFSVAFVALVATAALSARAATQDPAVAAGRDLWNKFQAKQIQCGQFTDINLENLGEYFMDQMMDGAHETMDQVMASRFGQSGLDQMHVAMGKRFSGCDLNASYPSGMMGYGMMPMMGYGYGPGWGYMGAWGWIIMVLFWVLVVAGIIALIRWVARDGRHRYEERSAFEILKERYARGEIDRKEFEEKKKDFEKP